MKAKAGPARERALSRILSWSLATSVGLSLLGPTLSFGQTSPELAMRDFSSGQIKKGVRSIGFGGDGATWGSYGLVYKDAGTALVDYGDTSYTNGNDFHFEAVGATTPPLWNGLAIYLIAMTESTNDVQLRLKSPGLASPRSDCPLAIDLSRQSRQNERKQCPNPKGCKSHSV